MKVDFDIKGTRTGSDRSRRQESHRAALEALRKANIGEVEIEPSQFEGAFALADIVNTESGEVILEANNEITPAKLQEIVEAGIDELRGLLPGTRRCWPGVFRRR